jgi:uracil-DNA glycosylase family 4
MNNIKTQKLQEIEKEIRTCSKCPLHKTRKLPVPGEGNIDTGIILIGLGPGYHENLQGKPFVGAAGKFLDELLELAGSSRKEVFITNVIKCYLPDNKPTEEEIEACKSYLDRQIEIIKPKIILTLGNVSTSYVLKEFGLKPESMWKIHGKAFQINNLLLQTKIIPMYHPASALYNPNMREILRVDWKTIKNTLQKL